MKPFKIQNRTLTSRRVKFIKNGGLITFTKDSVASFVENSREAGFCLTAITPIPPDDRGTKSIQLTGHPMGTDGRVSLYVDNNLTESIRYSNLARLEDRIAWFNQHFGAIIRYSGRAFATFESLVVGVQYRLVFEDDDIDFEFGEFGLAEASTNPTLFVEQYRLAFDLFNNKVEINCDGAVYDTPYMSLAGDWKLEINGESFTSEKTSVEDMLAILEANEIDVVAEGETDLEEKEPTKVTDYTFRVRYDASKQQLAGYYRPGNKVAVAFLSEGEEMPQILHPVTDSSGRWYLNHNAVPGQTYNMAAIEYRGDINEMFTGQEPTTFIQINTLEYAFSSTTPTPSGFDAQPDMLYVAGRANLPKSNVHIHYKLDGGAMQMESRDLSPFLSDSKAPEKVPLVTSLALFSLGFNDPIGALGTFLNEHTNMMAISRMAMEVVPSDALGAMDLRFLTSEDSGEIPLETPKTVTFYRGMSAGSVDLFDLLFPGYVGNYITLKATARINILPYLEASNVSVRIADNIMINHTFGPVGSELIHYDLTDSDNIQFKLLDMKPLMDVTSAGITGAGQVYVSNMVASEDSKLIVVSNALSNHGTYNRVDMVGRYQPDGTVKHILSIPTNSSVTPIIEGDFIYSIGSDGGSLNDQVWRIHEDDEAQIVILDGTSSSLKRYLVAPNTFIQISNAYDGNVKKWVLDYKLYVFNSVSENYSIYDIPQTSTLNAYGYFDQNTYGVASLNANRALFAMDRRLMEVRLDLESVEKAVITDVSSEFSVGEVNAIVKLSETAEHIYFIVTHSQDGQFQLHRYTKATDTLDRVGGDHTPPTPLEGITVISDNRIASTHSEAEPMPIIKFYDVNVTTGELTHLEYIGPAGKPV